MGSFGNFSKTRNAEPGTLKADCEKETGLGGVGVVAAEKIFFEIGMGRNYSEKPS